MIDRDKVKALDADLCGTTWEKSYVKEGSV